MQSPTQTGRGIVHLLSLKLMVGMELCTFAGKCCRCLPVTTVVTQPHLPPLWDSTGTAKMLLSRPVQPVHGSQRPRTPHQKGETAICELKTVSKREGHPEAPTIKIRQKLRIHILRLLGSFLRSGLC